jgi:DNA-binding IclR family transcriptional regulator
MILGNPAAAGAAPALSRGLAILDLLDDGRACSLDQVASALKLPRASVFRLLETLEQHGRIERLPDKGGYRSLVRITPRDDGAEETRRAVRQALVRLAERSPWTSEWYEGLPEGMILRDRREPTGVEVRVSAREGFCRSWIGELEAVARLGWAFFRELAGHPVIRRGTFWIYGKRDGYPTPLDPAEARRMVDEARARGWALDGRFNTNGVRRAARVITEPNGPPLGVLAIAESFQFGKRKPTRSMIEALQDVFPAIGLAAKPVGNATRHPTAAA